MAAAGTQGLISSISARLFSIGSSRGSFRGEREAFGAIAEREAHTGDRNAANAEDAMICLRSCQPQGLAGRG